MTTPTSRQWRVTTSSVRRVFVRDVLDSADYLFDWTDLLDGVETISASVWTTTLTTASATISGSTTYVTVSGGTAYVDVSLTNKITTSTGRVLERSVTIQTRNL